MTTHTMQPPKAVGLYDPSFEHDACGVGMVARLDNRPTHEVIQKAITALENLEHRGANGADPRTGDGAGILMQMPDELLRAVVDFELPPAGEYGVLMCFLPQDDAARARLEALLERTVAAEGQRLLGWRDVPVCPEHTGEVAGACRPVVRQLFVGDGSGTRTPDADRSDQDAFERKLYVIRRVCELTAEGEGLYVCSSSSRTLNYKGMLISFQLAAFYPDLQDERCKSALALVHSRFSTNTFPSWELAHPYRVICHNGEINTVKGNVNWMRARESELQSELFGEDLEKILPVVTQGNSDSATFDNVLELLMLAGRTPAHAVMMMIPEAYRDRDDLPEELKGFYAFHSCLMEPWDGPASVAFTDGRVVGATLDRNGLRPGRWVETTDGHVVLGSEIGLLDIPADQIRRLGRLQPGKLFLVDLERGRIVEDGEVKREVAGKKPYGEWYAKRSVPFAELPPSDQVTISEQPIQLRQRAFGYSLEDLRVLLTPMAREGAEPIGSMGNDLSLAVLSDQAPPLFSYFKQLFAQVTNPPIDPIREEVVMSLATSLGTELNLFGETPEHAHKLALEQPILLNRELETLRHVSYEEFAALHDRHHLAGRAGGRGDRGRARSRLRRSPRRDRRGREHHRPLRPADGPEPRADPLAAGGRLRPPPPRARGHAAARGDHPRVGRAPRGAPLRHAARLRRERDQPVSDARDARPAGLRRAHHAVPGEDGRAVSLTPEEAAQNTIKAIGKGLLKTISKMGISTIQSYCGAQIFEAVGLEPALIDRHFTGTASRIGGVGLEVLATEALERHARAWPTPTSRDGVDTSGLLPVGGVYAWRRDGEHHIWNPETIALVQHAVRAANGNVGAALQGDAEALATVRGSAAYEQYREYAEKVNEDSARKATLRGLLQIGGGTGDAQRAGGRSRSSRSSRRRRSSGASAPGR